MTQFRLRVDLILFQPHPLATHLTRLCSTITIAFTPSYITLVVPCPTLCFSLIPLLCFGGVLFSLCDRRRVGLLALEPLLYTRLCIFTLSFRRGILLMSLVVGVVVLKVVGLSSRQLVVPGKLS